MQDFPNLEESDAIIIDLTSLDVSLFEKMLQADPNKLKDMAGSILTLMNTDRHVYCIMSPLIIIEDVGIGPQGRAPPHHNYEWIMIPPILQPREGTSIAELADERFLPYFKQVGKWQMEIAGINEPMKTALDAIVQYYSKQIGPAFGYQPERALNLGLLPLAVNQSGKFIAGQVFVRFSRKRGIIYLLPPPTECTNHEGIELLLDLILGGKPDNKPSWWDNIDLPGLSELQREITKRASAIGKLQSEIQGIEAKRADLAKYRNLLCEDGSPLVDAVQRVFADLGINTKQTEPGFPVDLIREREIAIEVTGTTDKITAKTPKVGQVARFNEDHSKGEKVVIIANTFRRLPPNERASQMHFSPEAETILKAQKVCAMTGLTLFELWKSSFSGDKKKIVRRIMETNGILK